MSFDTWNDFYEQLWAQAAQSRGTAAAPDAGPSPMPEWPRTTGADAIALVALVEPIFAALPPRWDTCYVWRRWQTEVIELERAASTQPRAEYTRNRSLWLALLDITTILDAMNAPAPSENAIDAVFDCLWSPVELRNAAPTTKVITEGTTEKMWNAQRDEMMKLRGFDVREPTATIGGTAMKVPRTTNADILRLANYWGQQLAAFVPKAFFGGGASNTMGFQGQLKRWSAVIDDVDALARKGKPGDVYPKNHEFWHATIGLATNLAVWGETPRPFDLAIDATKQAVVDLPNRIADAAGAMAKAVGNVAREAGAGLLSGLGKPLLIGGGALLVVILLLRSGRNAETA